jgi:5-methylcytosine-specific restriction protein A
MGRRARPAHDRWHGLGRWKRMARRQLQREPLCAYCLRKGLVVPATVADHIVAHRGDERSHWEGRLQSLCGPCHVGEKAVIEHRGYSDQIGLDGLPIDPKHPINLR